jgi:N6-L-threonylcarbamoyladenine synthase
LIFSNLGLLSIYITKPLKNQPKFMKVLGIETSCDETSVSVVEYKNDGIKVLSNVISSQVKLHAKWGGVVPNLAAREHLKNIVPVLKLALKEASIKPENLDLISVTNGPGLIPALLIGTSSAKTLSYVWKKPLIGIHHIEGHIYANFVGLSSKLKVQSSKIFPALALVVSGGHTQLVLMKDHLKYEIIGQTLDDAAGEAFDKVARILDIGYPGGPAVSKIAANYKSRNKNYGISLPRPMLNRNNFDFSFSGLKTAALYETKKHLARNASLASASSRSDAGGSSTLFDKKYIIEICHEFQQAAIDVLVSKTIKAARKYNPKTIMLAGGVAANSELRKQLGEAIYKNMPATKYQIPDMEYTGDNAAMIATAACFRWQRTTKAQKEKALQNWRTLDTNANLKLK